MVFVDMVLQQDVAPEHAGMAAIIQTKLSIGRRIFQLTTTDCLELSPHFLKNASSCSYQLPKKAVGNDAPLHNVCRFHTDPLVKEPFRSLKHS